MELKGTSEACGKAAPEKPWYEFIIDDARSNRRELESLLEIITEKADNLRGEEPSKVEECMPNQPISGFEEFMRDTNSEVKVIICRLRDQINRL